MLKSALHNRRFKRVCCLPAFLVVLAFCIAFVVETGMIRYHSGQIATMLTDSAKIGIFVISSSILFLGLFGSIRSLYRVVRSLTINPVQPLRAALAEFISDEANEEEYNDLKPKGKYTCLSKRPSKPNDPVSLGNSTSLKNMAITAEEERARRADILIKEEFVKLCKLSLTFDRFLSQQQTRFIICLDASETKQCDVLAKLIYQIHSLVLTESSAPVAFVLEGNFKAKRNSGVMYTPRSIFGNRGSVAPLRGGQEKSPNKPIIGQLSRSNSTISRSVESCQGIAGLFMRDHELADWNGKLMKQLVSATSFTSRFLRLCNLEVPIEEMVLWISLVQYWPYHVAWLVVYLEGLVEGKACGTGKPISNQTCVNVIECFKEVKARVAASIDQLEPLVTDDRDLDRLEAYLRAKASRPIPIGNLKKLISQIMNPDRVPVMDDRRMGHSGPFAPALTTLVEEQVDPFRRANQNTGSIGPYSMSRSNSGKGRLTHMMMSTSLGSGDTQSGQFFPCGTDLMTSVENTPRTSFQEHRYIYQTNIRDRNLNGMVLYRIDSERVKNEIGMNPPDWQAFYRTLHYLREQENMLHEDSRNMRMMAEAESDSGSIVSPLVIANKHPCIRLTRSSPSSSLASSNHRMKNTTLIRQTPWLLSPQVPTSLMNSDGVEMPANDIVFPPVYPPENTENQASLSGMEEPESLWKPTSHPVGSKPVLKPRTVGDSSTGKPMDKSSSLKSSHEHVELETRKEIFASPRANIEQHIGFSKHNRRLSNLEQEKSVLCHKNGGLVNANVPHRNRSSRLARDESRRYSSRSTVDLRTAFGPLSFNPQAAELCYREVLRRKTKGRPKPVHMRHLVSSNDPRIFFNQAARNEAELFNYNILGYDQQQQQQPIHQEMAFAAVPISHRSPWKTPVEQQPDEEMKDLRRMKKRPCRRPSKGNQTTYDVFVNKNAQDSDMIPPALGGHGRGVQGGHPESAMIDSETDSVIYNPTIMPPYPGLMPWISSSGARRERRGRKLHHSPALNPAQLASLYSYVTHAGKLPNFPNPPFELSYGRNLVESEMNSSKINYFQFPTMNYPSHCAELTESYKPSQKKRARHAEHIPTAVASPRMVQTMVKSGHSSELVHVDYLDEGTNSPDSDAEECTCDYWYGIDRNGGKVTISEPTLRGDSDDLYSDENMQTYSLEHELSKRSPHGRTNGTFAEEENESG
ncbi:unnamed protein product [Echinostoma caproni]|uniref:KAP NTPase domain-containing protein n=1 Tax=Echinostoma caproni TaxID=27848 RepID=A0A183A7I7_9TREM|nr:unnamed protein product [Echinostoma caproni]